MPVTRFRNSLKPTSTCRILPGHSAEETRQTLIGIFKDSRITVRFDDGNGKVSDRAPDTKAFPPVLPRSEVLQALERVAKEMWPGAPVIPDMETGASDSIYTTAAGMPSYGVSGVAIDQDDIRAHGKDERLRVSSYYGGVEFYYRFLVALTKDDKF